MEQKIEIHVNTQFPQNSHYEWLMVMNEVTYPINNFYFDCPCYSALNKDKTLPIIVILAAEVTMTEDLGKKLVNLK